MPWGLKRYYEDGDLTSSPSVVTDVNHFWPHPRVATCFSGYWSRYGVDITSFVLGYVVMPEHVHLLISEPEKKNPSVLVQALTLGFARRLVAAARRHNRRHPPLFDHAPRHIWQARFYDFNVWTDRKRVEKLEYMHRNPVKRGLVEAPEMWRWSSYRSYAFRENGPVDLNHWEVQQLKVDVPQSDVSLEGKNPRSRKARDLGHPS
jgi:putative transposase